VQLSLRVRSHDLLVYRLCLLPDTPIIFKIQPRKKIPKKSANVVPTHRP